MSVEGDHDDSTAICLVDPEHEVDHPIVVIPFSATFEAGPPI
jgi:hypothetical protein